LPNLTSMTRATGLSATFFDSIDPTMNTLFIHYIAEFKYNINSKERIIHWNLWYVCDFAGPIRATNREVTPSVPDWEQNTKL
jgi:hypothetical protein